MRHVFLPCLVPPSPPSTSPSFFFLSLFPLRIIHLILLLTFLCPPTPKLFLAFAQGLMRNLENLASPRPLLELRTREDSGAVGSSLVMGAESAVGSASVLSANKVALFWLSQSTSHCSLLRSSIDFSALSSSICCFVFGVAFSKCRSIFSRRFISSQYSCCLLVRPSYCRGGSPVECTTDCDIESRGLVGGRARVSEEANGTT